jgi:hypothetical protein
MTLVKKITKTNFLPETDLGSVPVYGDKFNKLIDILFGTSNPTEGALKADTVSEHTSGSGVTLDGVLLKDGGVQLDKGTVTQETAITTGVTLNKPAGVITTVSSTLAAGSNATFRVTNSFVKSTSVVLLTVDDSATAGLAKLNVQDVTNGTFDINITNIHGANAFNNLLKIHFTIL